MNQLPIEVASEIISRLSSVKEKVRCKTLSKYWKDAAIGALSRQACLSFGETRGFLDYMLHWVKCWDRESHVFNEDSKLNIKVIRSNRFRRKFFSEFCCLKIIRFPQDQSFTRVWKYYLTEGPHQHVQCLQVFYLEFPVNLPNLRHLSCEGLTVEVLNSIINNSPHLTQLTLNVYRRIERKNQATENFSDVLSRLPLGLQYLRMKCFETDVFAVLSSPAMTTIKCLYFDKVWRSETGSFDKLEFCPCPHLEIFGIKDEFRSIKNHKRSNTFLDYLRTAKNMKRVELSMTWLSVEDRVTLLNRWSDMTMIKLGINENTELDELIDVILTNNRETLETLHLGVFTSVKRDSWEKLGNFSVLKRLGCYFTQVSFIISEKQELIQLLNYRLIRNWRNSLLLWLKEEGRRHKNHLRCPFGIHMNCVILQMTSRTTSTLHSRGGTVLTILYWLKQLHIYNKHKFIRNQPTSVVGYFDCMLGWMTTGSS